MKFIKINNISLISGLIWPFLDLFWWEKPQVKWYGYWQVRKQVTRVIHAGLPVPLPTYTTFYMCGIFIEDNYPDTRVVFFRFSAHHRDMYCIFTYVWHIYWRHLPTKLLLYIQKILRKFRIFPRTITWTPGCFFRAFCTFWDMYCIFICMWHSYSRHLATKLLVYILKMLWKFCIFPRTITQTSRGLFQVFHTSLGHVLHFYMSVTYLFRMFTMKLVLYILQMLQKFCVFLGHLPRHNVYMCCGCVENLMEKTTLVSR